MVHETQHCTRRDGARGPDEAVFLPDGTCPLSFLGDLVSTWGPNVRYETRIGPKFLLTEPEAVKHALHDERVERMTFTKMVLGDGLIASEGSYWRAQRRMMQGDFQTRCMRGFVPQMEAIISRRMAALEAAADHGRVLHIADEMTRVTLEIIVATLFGASLSEERIARLCDAVAAIMNELGGLADTAYGALRTISAARGRQFRAALAVVDEEAKALLEARRAETCPSSDLLNTLLTSENRHTGEALTEQQLRDEVVTMMLAGHETTAIGLTWAWSLLDRHPSHRTRLLEEVDTVVGDQPLTWEHISALTYTHRFVLEAFRLYPPVWMMSRVVREDTHANGIRMPAKSVVLICPYLTHRDPAHWPVPERFDPDRFLPEQVAARHRQAHIPFAAGRHLCLGNNFALTEAVAVLSLVSRRFIIRPVSPSAPTPIAGMTLRVDGGLPSTVHRRGNAS